MKINFPTKFEVEYPKENRSYYEGKYKKDIALALLKASDSYCMYCGRKLIIDNENLFNLEHSIERDGYPNIDKPKTPFKHCKYNLSVACIRCNQKYKNRMIERIPYFYVCKELHCSSKNCNEPCDEYSIARAEYLKRNKIILQPSGVKNESNVYYNIQYNLLKQIYSPDLEKVSAEDIDFIEEHIARFNLNRDTSSTCIMEVCELAWRIIETIPESYKIEDIYIMLREVKFNNVIAYIFIDFLEETMSDKTKLKNFCRLYMILSYV